MKMYPLLELYEWPEAKGIALPADGNGAVAGPAQSG